MSRFATARVRTSHRAGHGGAEEGPLWLLVEWPETEEAPTKFWLSNLPPEAELLSLVRLAKIRWWIEQGYQQLKDELGLDHYEGRTWQGWHHHVTMNMVAFGFLALESLYRKKLLDSPGRCRRYAVNCSACWRSGLESAPGADDGYLAANHLIFNNLT